MKTIKIVAITVLSTLSLTLGSYTIAYYGPYTTTNMVMYGMTASALRNQQEAEKKVIKEIPKTEKLSDTEIRFRSIEARLNKLEIKKK